MKTLQSIALRAVTGFALVGVMIAAIIGGPYTFAAFFAILVAGVLFEFYTLINVSREVNIMRPVHSTMGAVLFGLVFCDASHLTTNWVFIIYMAYVMGMFISRLYIRHVQHPIRELSYIILGQLYIAVPISILAVLAFHTKAFPMGTLMLDYSPIFILSLFFFIWINDTGAYLTGMTCSRLMKTHPLFPRVSPKKTWEGVYGGVFFVALLAWLLSYNYVWEFLGIDIHDGIRLSTIQWILMGVVVSVFSTYGDLIESFVKRSVGVKDSGNILPGHGGLWDRFDSLIMAAPAMAIFLIVTALF